ncbi:two component transcriptional regulator, LuxR family [Pseudomonas sp. NFIX49]|jgi:DNA-binding NarL/FixJ family response regulator|nr:two component transcriptional regulator, LuxR family [Pseudomonas sp. NFIX46]SDB35129.1 two component transcriptional regulator, LuxR family [Pseudomonas putida]SFQ88182.1 two component transcriptional regulator, LuxR family [Pseudomonas sp. NFIX49]
MYIVGKWVYLQNNELYSQRLTVQEWSVFGPGMEWHVNKLTSAVKVIVVDDQPLIVEELCEFLESSGYRCVPCESSKEAIERFTGDTAIGLVLCDLHMPDMDGIQLVQELQRLAGKHRAFEAIMLTGRADKQDVIKALRAGIADYYQKPVNLDELLEGLQRQEAVLQERQKTLQLGHLNQKLQDLSSSIDDLYQDLDKVRRAPAPVSDEAHREAGELEIPSIFNQLSPRQLDVARLVGKGQTNYQIACELGITENTVKLYVSQVLRLTHMHNRTQLALALSPSSAALRQRVTAH